jgi:general secretion pathway protein D
MHPTYLIPNRRTLAMLMAVASTMPAVTTSAEAQSGLAQREMIRRQNDIAEAERLLNEGREVYAKGDYQMAVDKYRQSLGKVPDVPSNPALVQRRQVIMQHFADASVALAMQNRKVGKYDEARALLESVIKEDPNNFIASRELGYLDDPIRTNPSLTYEHTQNVDKVRRTLYMAEGHYNLGKYDDAKKEYENVLRIDPYNSAARRGLERLAQARSDYYRAAYDQTRAELLSEVDKAWELSVPSEAPENFRENYGKQRPDGTAYITEKLRRIMIPSISFEDITVEEAIDFLRMRSKELDAFELDPAKKGVNFVIRRPRAATAAADTGLDVGEGLGDALALPGGNDPSALRISELRVTNIPLEQALKYICDATRLKYKIDEYSVTLVPQSEDTQDVFTRTFSVPPDFQTSLGAGAATGGAAEIDPFADTAQSGPRFLEARPPVIELLKKAGVNFGPGASASLSPNGVLLVTNTPSELDKIEQLVDSIIVKQPKQVKITTKFVEITQENNDELGFDWIISPFSIGTDMFGAGGTIGNGLSRVGDDFTGPAIPGALPGQNDVNNIVTAGNRSGDGAVARNSIDAVLNNPNRTAQNQNVAPGIMSLTGLFSDGEVKMIMRGLSQKKGTDLMTAPSITAISGQTATIEIIREFIYPTEYEPPEIPTSFGNQGNNQGGGGLLPPVGGGIQTFPVTPATPTSFETRNTGVTLEVAPIIGDNDFLIDLNFVPEITEFEGFVNYGSPITTGGTDALGNPVQIVLTENRIEMPVFSTRRVKSRLSIYDGYTVAVGGLMREDVQMVEDKVPILGDIPLIGRLFQSQAENRIKSNLIVFITAQIIDATGRPLRGAAVDPIPGGDAPELPAGAPGGMIDPILLEGLNANQ